MEQRIRSLEPVAAGDAKALVLGSMPGQRSLAAAQYYAHPRNAFWPIMQALFGVPASAAYAQRLQALQTHGIALWDVLHSCHRKGSLDAQIESGSIEVNDFNAFFRRCPEVEVILLNGATAQRYFELHVVPSLERNDIARLRMPSTSPAHAAKTLAQKTAEWRSGIQCALVLGASGANPARRS